MEKWCSEREREKGEDKGDVRLQNDGVGRGKSNAGE